MIIEDCLRRFIANLIQKFKYLNLFLWLIFIIRVSLINLMLIVNDASVRLLVVTGANGVAVIVIFLLRRV